MRRVFLSPPCRCQTLYRPSSRKIKSWSTRSPVWAVWSMSAHPLKAAYMGKILLLLNCRCYIMVPFQLCTSVRSVKACHSQVTPPFTSSQWSDVADLDAPSNADGLLENSQEESALLPLLPSPTLFVNTNNNPTWSSAYFCLSLLPWPEHETLITQWSCLLLSETSHSSATYMRLVPNLKKVHAEYRVIMFPAV
jgi:hypothetical protein